MDDFLTGEDALVIRTDFTDDVVWKSICDAVQQPDKEFGFRAYVRCVSDRKYEGYDVAKFVEFFAQYRHHTFVFVVDHTTITDPEFPILVIDLLVLDENDVPGRSFRVIPSEMWGVENNLSVANMNFEEFYENVDADGVFRSFR